MINPVLFNTHSKAWEIIINSLRVILGNLSDRKWDIVMQGPDFPWNRLYGHHLYWIQTVVESDITHGNTMIVDY
jgi:hypothetical protein